MFTYVTHITFENIFIILCKYNMYINYNIRIYICEYLLICILITLNNILRDHHFVNSNLIFYLTNPNDTHIYYCMLIIIIIIIIIPINVFILYYIPGMIPC